MRNILAIIILLSFIGCSKPPPKILIIGDSISTGYTPFVKEIHALNATDSDNVHYTKEGYKLLAKKVIEGLSQFDSRLMISIE